MTAAAPTPAPAADVEPDPAPTPAPLTADQLRARAARRGPRMAMRAALASIVDYLESGELPDADADEVMVELDIIALATRAKDLVYERRAEIFAIGKRTDPPLTNHAMGARLGISDVMVVKTLQRREAALAEAARQVDQPG